MRAKRKVILFSVLFGEVVVASDYRPDRPGGSRPAPQGEGCLRGEAASLSPQDCAQARCLQAVKPVGKARDGRSRPSPAHQP